MKKTRWYRALFALPVSGRAVLFFAADSKPLAYDHAQHCLAASSDWPKGMALKGVTFYGWDEPKTAEGASLAGVLHIDAHSDWRAA